MLNDLRYAFRMLSKSPGFAATAILILGLAIGANTAIFSLVDALLIEPLPYPQPERLAHVTRTYRGDSINSEDIGHNGRVWEAVRDHATTVDAAVSSNLAARVNLTAGDRAVAVRQQRVGAGYFGVLGIGPARGREFTRDEDRPQGPPVVVLSAALWRSAFRGDPAIVGRTILLRGEPSTVVGVMTEGFRGPVDADVWTPLRPSTTGEGEGQNYTIVARLRPDVTWPAAAAEMAAIIDPVILRRTSASGATIAHAVSPLQIGLTGHLRRPLLLLQTAVLLVLLVACVNLAGLLLARAGQRTREIATRLAIGGNRFRVTRQLFVESLLIAFIGGALKVVVGWVGLEALKGLAVDVFAEWQDVSLDGRVLLAAAALTLLTSLAFGLIPALQASRLDVQAALAEGGTRAVAGGARGWPRRLLVVGEVALGMMLLVGAGLLLRTFAHLQGLTPGFDSTNVVTATVSLDDARYRGQDAVQRLFDESLARLRAAPGVESAAVTLGLPYERILNFGARVVGSEARGEITSAAYISDGFFEALRIPLRQGRVLDASDRRDGPRVVVVNEAFVRTFLRERDPLTQRLQVESEERAIVGVVGDVRQVAGWGNYGPVDVLPTVYMPISQVSDGFLRLVHTWFSPSWIVRGSATGAAVVPAVRSAIEETDQQLPIVHVRAMDDVRVTSIARQRLLMMLVVALGVAALLLAAIGIHRLIASTVSERTRELGIRLALGSTVAQAMRTAVLPGIYLTFGGLALGVVMALGATGLIRGLLWGVRANDPATFIGVSITLFGVALVASVLPALRVRRVDPAALLRE